jgi:membrane-anchored glycerophosphoryl diester phosphodiesterase (GDPDase)
MKRKVIGILLVCAVLMLNIIFTQYMVHQYFFEHYSNSLIAAIINLILFPIAIFIYKNDQKYFKGVKANDK